MSITIFPVEFNDRPAKTGRRFDLTESPRRAIGRRGTLEPGRALEALGHAVEHLADSRFFQGDDHNRQDEQEAVQILMRLSRAVFVECADVLSLRLRIRRWLNDRLASNSVMHHNGCDTHSIQQVGDCGHLQISKSRIQQLEAQGKRLAITIHNMCYQTFDGSTGGERRGLRTPSAGFRPDAPRAKTCSGTLRRLSC